MAQYAYHAKISNFVEHFESGMVRLRSIQVSHPLSSDPISGVESGMGQGYSVWVSGLGPVLPGLPATAPAIQPLSFLPLWLSMGCMARVYANPIQVFFVFFLI